MSLQRKRDSVSGLWPPPEPTRLACFPAQHHSKRISNKLIRWNPLAASQTSMTKHAPPVSPLGSTMAYTRMIESRPRSAVRSRKSIPRDGPVGTRQAEIGERRVIDLFYFILFYFILFHLFTCLFTDFVYLHCRRFFVVVKGGWLLCAGR